VTQSGGGGKIVDAGAVTRGIILTCLATSCYALVPNLARYAVLAGVPALESIVLRTFVVALVLSLAAMVLKTRLVFSWAALPSLFGQTLATLCVSLCYIGSLQYLSVGLSVLIFFTAPVLVVLLSPLVEGRKLRAHQTVLSLLAFAGLALALGPSFDKMHPLGLGLACLSAFGYAAQQFTGRPLGQHMEPVAFGALVHIFILPVVVVVATWVGEGQSVYLSGHAGWIVMASGFGFSLAYCGGYFLQMSGVKYAPASTVIPYFNLEPVLTTLVAFLFLGEQLSLLHIIGAGLVIGSLLVMNLLDRRFAE
jgi:drug/metabolite transporter (DMT)-like permease